MLTHKIRLQLIAFVAIALLASGYLGTRYAGLGSLFGGSAYQLSAALPSSGGIFTNAEVTYRGVPVGRVGDLQLTSTGISAVLKIEDGAPDIPADVTISVVNRSVIGEQYIDLRPSSSGGPYLKAGDQILGLATSLPTAVDSLLLHTSEFVSSVPADDLRTVVDEIYQASQGASGNLRRLLAASREFVQTANTGFEATAGLIDHSSVVLATQEQSAGSIVDFSRSLNLLAGTMKTSDPALRSLIASAPAAAIQIDELFRSVGVPLGVLMSNLISTVEVFGTNPTALADSLFRLPQAINIGWNVAGGGSLQLGLAQTYFDPKPCTSGYGGTTLRPGLQTDDGRALNLDAGCTAPTASGSNVRGPQSLPGAIGSSLAAEVTVPNTLADLMGGKK